MPRVLRLVLVAAGAVVIAMLVRSVGVRNVGDLLVRVGWAFPAVASLYLGHVSLRALALWRTLNGPRLRDVLHVRLSAEAVEMLTFTGPFLAEPAKGVMLTKYGVAGADAIRAIATEYALYTVTSTWLAVLALWLLFSRGLLPPALHTPVLWIIAAMIVFMAVAAIAALIGRIPLPRSRVAQVVGIELAGQALLACEILVTVRALGFPFSSLQSVIVEGAVKFISIAFFFVPGQLGAQESVYTLLFASLGFPGAIGLTMALVRRVRGLVVATVALAVTYAL